MNSKLVKDIANAVLYEGYMLYPYRPSAVKNRQRWNFGLVYPKSYSEMQNGTDPWVMQTECLIRGDGSATLEVNVRFLQCIACQREKSPEPAGEIADDSKIPPGVSMTVGIENQVFQSWQEAAECDQMCPPSSLAGLLDAPALHGFTFPGGRGLEPPAESPKGTTTPIIRTRETITGSVVIGATQYSDDIFKLTVLLSNLTGAKDPELLSRDDVLLKSFLSTHTILGVTGAEFVSLIDPPKELQRITSECKNVGTWPVLVGKANSRDAMLSSPIILYDYPQIAPESAGDLFDGTEIDEILALRILTLSDDEKREIRQTDQRAREVLERTEAMPTEHFMKLHGILRGVKPSMEADGIDTFSKDQR